MLFPAWYIGQPNAGNILSASHSTELAERFGRRVRGYARQYGNTLGYSMSGESEAAGRWEVLHEGDRREYYAVGAGVGIAGFRAALGIIDDPFRSRQDAESKLIRDRIWDWFNDDFTTRLIPRAPVALVMTRWHEDDLAGRIIERAKTTGEKIEQVSIPAIAEENDSLGRKVGEWLWEGEYGYAELLRERHRKTDPRSWASLYQQRPAPESGGYFKRDWLKYYDSAPTPSRMNVYGASDYAVTADGGDYTVHVVIGVDPKGELWLLDLWRGQTSSDEWVSSWCDLVNRWEPEYWAEEHGQIKSGVGPFRDKMAVQRKAWTTLEAFPTRGDKAVRAQSIRGIMSMQGLNVPRYAPWVSDLIDELLAFPAGKHDDQVDALGLFGQLLDKVWEGPNEAKPDKLQAPSDLDRWGNDEDSTSWRL